MINHLFSVFINVPQLKLEAFDKQTLTHCTRSLLRAHFKMERARVCALSVCWVLGELQLNRFSPDKFIYIFSLLLPKNCLHSTAANVVMVYNMPIYLFINFITTHWICAVCVCQTQCSTARFSYGIFSAIHIFERSHNNGNKKKMFANRMRQHIECRLLNSFFLFRTFFFCSFSSSTPIQWTVAIHITNTETRWNKKLLEMEFAICHTHRHIRMHRLWSLTHRSVVMDFGSFSYSK